MQKRIASILILSTFVIAAFAICPIRPTFITPISPTGDANAGEEVTFRVGISEAASGSQPISISADNPTQFSSLPATIYVPNGQTSKTFSGTLANSASGGVTVYAEANGHQVDCYVTIASK